MGQHEERRDLWWPTPAIELAKVLPLEGPPFRAERGGTLPELQVAYQSWGTLDEDRSNAALIIHPMTADTHVAGVGEQPPGWWDALVGPGKALDTNELFVICPNLVGGCYGSTGPRFPAPDGEPWLERFPLLTPRDLMRVQRLFLEQLGIERLRLVVGPSMGGMVAWEWAIEASDAVETVVVVAAPLVTSAQQIAWNWLQRRGIELDIAGSEESARWGQMVARGIGMVSYRSPVGLEEKFGREWFKKPGATLGDRGMYNIESWLRQHGRRIAKRFCPYTWILYSRLMDLHDIAEGRGGTLAALDAVRSKVVVVGIDTDNLYPAKDVHLGADILRHLGRSVEYAELRSLHGHDAFLLELDQLERVLRGAQRADTSGVPTTETRALRRIRLGLLGTGRVASALVRLLCEREDELAVEHGLAFDVVAAADIDAHKKLGTEFAEIDVGHDPSALVARGDLDVIVELTRGTDTSALISAAIEAGRSIVTPNKTLVHDHGEALETEALERGVRLAYHASIAAGWPLLFAIERLLDTQLYSRIEAVLSGPCNLVLEKVEEGSTLEEALAGIGHDAALDEAPILHTSGWVAAQKLLLAVSHARQRRYMPGEITLRGIEWLDGALVREARQLGLRVRLVGLYRESAERGAAPEAGVLPVALPEGGHLGSARGRTNVVVLGGEGIDEIVHTGKSEGPLPVATAVLSDLIGIADLSRSWTGRFKRAGRPASTPHFERYVRRQGGRVAIVAQDGPGAIPLLD